MVCRRGGDGSSDLVCWVQRGQPVLQDHLLKVNHIFFFGRLFWLGMFYECMEEDFHPCDKTSMKAQMPKLFFLCLVLRKGLCYMLPDLLDQFGMTSAL